MLSFDHCMQQLKGEERNSDEKARINSEDERVSSNVRFQTPKEQGKSVTAEQEAALKRIAAEKAAAEEKVCFKSINAAIMRVV